MSKMYNVVQGKRIEGRDKSLWLKIGKAFEKEGKPMSIKLDVLPIPNEKNEIWLNLFEADSDGASASSNTSSQPQGASNGGGMHKINDEIPF